MKIYLAARFARRAELQGYAEELREAGHECSARWLSEETDSRSATDEDRQRWAVMEMADISKSDMLIAFTEKSGVKGASRGGRHVEFGAAVAMNLPIVVVGPRENLFHHLPGLEVVESFEEALAHIKENF